MMTPAKGAAAVASFALKSGSPNLFSLTLQPISDRHVADRPTDISMPAGRPTSTEKSGGLDKSNTVKKTFL